MMRKNEIKSAKVEIGIDKLPVAVDTDYVMWKTGEKAKRDVSLFRFLLVYDMDRKIDISLSVI